MSRGLRWLGAVALACATLPVFSVSTAHADAAVIAPSNSGYFYIGGVDKPDPSPAEPPNVGKDTDGVAPGNLAVAASGGQENKVSFLFFDVFSLPLGATIDKAVVKLVLVPVTQTNISYQAAPENVRACMAGDQGFNGDDAVGLAKAPKRLCDKFTAPAKASADGKAFEFDVTALANEWLTGANDGVAFTVAEGAPSNSFQIVFEGMSSATLALTFTAPVEELPEEPPVVNLPEGSTGGVVTSPPDTSGGGFAPPPSTGGFPPAPEVPPTTGVPPVTGTPTTSEPVNNVALSVSSRPTNTFWLALFALVGALALISLICGDKRVAASQQKNSRLTKSLSARQSAGQGMIARPTSW